jgi:hypothetical protein
MASSQAPAQPINVKLLLIGNSSVGKSSLLLRFSDEQWVPEDEASATIGVDFRVHKMDIDGKKVKLSIWVRIFLYFFLIVLIALFSAGHRRARTLPDHNIVVLPWCTWRDPRVRRCQPRIF